MSVTKTGNIHTDAAAGYYDQPKSTLAALQSTYVSLQAQIQAALQEISAATPADKLARYTEFTTDLAAYLTSQSATNAAQRAGFFVAAVQGQTFSQILASIDAYLAAGGV